MADEGHANPEFHAGLRRGATIAMRLRQEHPDLSWEQWAEKLREGIQAEMQVQSDIAKESLTIAPFPRIKFRDE